MQSTTKTDRESCPGCIEGVGCDGCEVYAELDRAKAQMEHFDFVRADRDAYQTEAGRLRETLRNIKDTALDALDTPTTDPMTGDPPTTPGDGGT